MSVIFFLCKSKNFLLPFLKILTLSSLKSFVYYQICNFTHFPEKLRTVLCVCLWFFFELLIFKIIQNNITLDFSKTAINVKAVFLLL